MTTTAELFTIGQLARRTGVPARTIRFWSDAGLVPPAARSGSGYRLYDADAVARLDLVRTLRELGLGLDVVQAVLTRACTVAEVAAAHVAVLDAQIRTLRLRRAVLSTVARGGHTIEETLIMHKLARLSAQERQRIIDDFVDEHLRGHRPGRARGGHRTRHAAAARRPAGRSGARAGERLGRARRTRRQRGFPAARPLHGAGRPERQPGPGRKSHPAQVDSRAVAEQAGPAAAEGIAPGSPEGKAILDRIVAPGTPAAQRARLLEQLETFTDARVERYWQLLAIINGKPVPPSVVPGFEWLIAALRADLGS